MQHRVNRLAFPETDGIESFRNSRPAGFRQEAEQANSIRLYRGLATKPASTIYAMSKIRS